MTPTFKLNPGINDHRIEDAMETVLTQVDKFDNGMVTREDMAKYIRLAITRAVHDTWDDAFTRGVQDAELDEDDDDEEIEFDFDDRED